MKRLLLASFLAFLFNAAVGQSIISTTIGTGTTGYSGDGGPASLAELSNPGGLAYNSMGDLYFCDIVNMVVRKVEATTGIITTVAGTGTSGYSGDGGLATDAEFLAPAYISIDASDNLYISDLTANVIRKVDVSTGIITTFAGNGTAGYSGDGGPATAAEFYSPYGTAFGTDGSLYIAEQSNHVIRKVDPSGVISTIAGTGIAGYNGDGIVATTAQLSRPRYVTFNNQAELLISEGDGQRIRKVDVSGLISTIVGTGTQGNAGDGGLATAAEVNFPRGIVVDPVNDHLYFTESTGMLVRKVDNTGIITTIAGSYGSSGYSGDGGLAINSILHTPRGITVAPDGSVWFADSGNDVIRRISNIMDAVNCTDLTVQLDGTGAYSFSVGSSSPQTDINQLVPSGIFNGTSVWQSFFPTTSGILYSGSVIFSSAHSPASSLTVNIYDGQGTSGALLASRTYTNPVTFSANTPTEFILDETIDVITGNEYTIEVIDDNGDIMQIRKGSAYVGTAGGVGSISASDDLAFSTKVLQRPDIDNGSYSTVGITSFDVDASTFTCTNIGANTVTLTVTDNEANSTSCTATITVEDDESPVAVCQDISVNLDPSGNASIVATDIDGGSTDNCTLTYSANVTSFDCGDVGSNTVTLTVTDPGTNTDNCTATVTVVDNTPPTSTCQPHTLVLDASGAATLTPADVDGGSTDNCGVASRGISKTSFNCGDLGTNSVTLTITDINGNTATCNATVTVEDNENPAIVCPADITVCSADNSGSIVTYTEPSGTDNCAAVTTQTDVTGLTNGSLFPIGTTVQTWTATDGTGNSSSCSFNVIVDASPIADFVFSPTCQGESTFFTDQSTIDASSSIVSWQWDMGDGSAPIGLVDPIHAYGDTGMYDVMLLVESAQGCTDDTTLTVHVTPVPVAGFSFATACEGDATVFTNTSTIDAGNLSYAWDFGDSNTSTDENPAHTYTVDGTYTVTLTVTSDNGCEDVISQSVTVHDSPNALFTASTECDGFATTFTNLSSGDGTLTYSWDFGDLSPTSTDAAPTHTYATAGTYNAILTVTNNHLCTDVHSVSVTVHALPTVDFSFANVCEGTPASFTNNSTSGSNSWEFGDFTNSTLVNPTHTYTEHGVYDVTLTVTDSNFCINSSTQQIEVFDLPNFSLDITDVLCYGEATGEIVVVAVPPVASPWTLSIDGNTPQASVTFSNLEAGTYSITAYDANGCEFTVSGTVSQPSDTLGIEVQSLENILCHGTETGTIEVSGTGGTSPYTYAIDGNPAQPFGTFTNLEAGNHTIQITDFNACVFDTIITLTEPDTLVLTLDSANDLLCNGDNSGNLTVVGTGGIAPYSYNINGSAYDTSAYFEGLAAGTHVVGVLDANGCSDTLHVTLTEPGILMLSLVSSQDATCFQSANGSIETQAASGTAPYQYSLDGVSFQGSGLFQGLSAGTYTVTVKDANGCLDQLTETLTEPTELTIETSSSPVSCFGEDDGTIQITANGGTAPYLYSTDGGVMQSTTATFTNVDGGNYLAVVEDANGCTASEGVVISEPTAPFELSATVNNVACLGDSTGSVTLAGLGGTPTYTFSANNIDFATANTIEGFATGNVTLYGKDLHGCLDSIQVFVDQPSSAVSISNTLLSNPACPNEASGAVTVQASGGTPGYMYSANNGLTYQSNPILSNISGGNHIIAVQDANGCTDTTIVTLTSPAIISISYDSLVHVSCENDVNGEIHVSASGGTPSYTYILNAGNPQTNGDFLNLTDGTYQLTVMDVNGCTYSEAVSVNAAEMQPVAAFNFTTSGEAVLFQNNSAFGNAYLWEFGDDSTSTEASPVHVYAQPGNYNVTLTVTNACGSQSLTTLVSTTATGISTAQAATFNLYPNPASTELYITSSENIDQQVALEIITISGQTVLATELNAIQSNNRIKINVDDLAQGLYFLRVIAPTNQSVLRFDIIK